MKKLSAILLLAIMLISAIAVPASAAIPPQLYGDVDYDESVNIMDATVVQQHLANIILLDSCCCEAADIDADAKITILDATLIQQYLANIITEFPAGEYYYIDKYFFDVIPSYLSGKAQVGKAVDFEVDGYAYPSPQKAYLYVNENLVDTAIDEDSTLTYTFETACTYLVKVVLTDKWGDVAGTWETSYEVVEPVTDTSVPYINNIAITDKAFGMPTITVDAVNGSGDYTYSYYITYPYPVEEYVFTKENTTENSVTLEYGVLDYFEYYVLNVFVTDSNGNKASASTTFMCEELAPA